MHSRRKHFVSGSLLAGLGLCAMTGTAAPAIDGGTVYAKVCRHCHDAGVGPVIRGRNLQVDYVQRVVRFGNRAMPSFRASEIDDAALAAVAQLVASSPATPAK